MVQNRHGYTGKVSCLPRAIEVVILEISSRRFHEILESTLLSAFTGPREVRLQRLGARIRARNGVSVIRPHWIAEISSSRPRSPQA
jgi:hypothetical protein